MEELELNHNAPEGDQRELHMEKHDLPCRLSCWMIPIGNSKDFSWFSWKQYLPLIPQERWENAASQNKTHGHSDGGKNSSVGV